MHPKTQLTAMVVTLGLLLGLAGPLVADTSPQAQAWLDKLLGVYQRGPFTVEYSAELDLEPVGQPTNGTLSGKITYGDREHVRLEMTIALTDEEAGSGEPMAMELLSVRDGAINWSEVTADGARQVTKISQEDAEALAATGGGDAGGSNPTTMDPVAQLESMARTMDFELLGVDGGRVTLRGTANDASMAEELQLASLGVETFVLVLEEKTGFPVEMRAGEPPLVEMEFKNLEFVDRDALPEGVFDYTPPADVPVTDLGVMLQLQSQ